MSGEACSELCCVEFRSEDQWFGLAEKSRFGTESSNSKGRNGHYVKVKDKQHGTTANEKETNC